MLRLFIGALVMVAVACAPGWCGGRKWEPNKSLTIIAPDGSVSIGTYNRQTGTYEIINPDRDTWETGTVDAWGNVTINKFNIPGGKADRESQGNDN